MICDILIPMLTEGVVVAARKIYQSPLTDAPDIPKGTRGYVEDEDAPYLLVDFGEPYGVVIVDPDEVR